MTTFTDDFNRSDSTNLGANWVEVSGDWSIISNQLSSGNAGGTVILRAAGAMASNDHSAQITITATAAVSHGVWCRGNSNISQGYLWRNDGTSWNLFSVVGGSFVSIGSYAAAAVAGDVAKIQAVGSTIKGFVNGVQRVSVTDTAVATGTSVGLRAESTNSLRFDDFAAADVTSGVTGDAAFSGTATLSASGLRAAVGGAALAVTAGLTAGGVRATTADAGLSATAGLTAGGIRSTSGGATLTGTAGLTADGVRAAAGAASLSATAGLAATGVRGVSGSAALAVSASLSASGVVVTSGTGDAALTATAALAAAGAVGRSLNASLTGTAALVAAGAIGTASGASLAVTAGLHASGQVSGAIVSGSARRGTGAQPGARRAEPAGPRARRAEPAVPTARGGAQ